MQIEKPNEKIIPSTGRVIARQNAMRHAVNLFGANILVEEDGKWEKGMEAVFKIARRIEDYYYE